MNKKNNFTFHSRSTRLIFFSVVVACLAGLTYINTLSSGFVFDENILITDNVKIRSLDHPSKFFITKFWPGQSRDYYYRPLIILSYALNYAIAGQEPLVYHLTNLLLHVIACVLLFFLFRKIIPELRENAGDVRMELAAFIGAAIFAVHPVHAESVAWVPGRTDVLAAVFMIGSWLMLARAGSQHGWRGCAGRAGGVLLFALAIMSKEIAIVFPVMIIAYDYLSAADAEAFRKRVKSNALEYLAFIAVAIVYLMLRTRALSGPGEEPAPAFFAAAGLLKKISTMSLVWLWYVKLLIYPHPLRLDYFYGMAFAPGRGLAAGLVAFAAIVSLILIVVVKHRRWPLASLLVLCFCLSLIPFSHVISIPTLMAERFLYLPSVFFCLAAGLALYGLFTRRGAAASVLIAVTVTLLISLTLFRNGDFSDGFRFWRVSVRQVPDLAVAHNLMGVYALERNMWHLAEREFKRTVELDPGFSQARMNLAKIALDQDRVGEAIKLLEQAVTEMPELSSARFNLAMAYIRIDRKDDGERELKKAIALDQTNIQALIALGDLCRDTGRKEQAGQLYEKALGLDPNNQTVVKRMAEIAGVRGQ